VIILSSSAYTHAWASLLLMPCFRASFIISFRSGSMSFHRPSRKPLRHGQRIASRL
jgi:hypothetical protein